MCIYGAPTVHRLRRPSRATTSARARRAARATRYRETERTGSAPKVEVRGLEEQVA